MRYRPTKVSMRLVMISLVPRWALKAANREREEHPAEHREHQHGGDRQDRRRFCPARFRPRLPAMAPAARLSLGADIEQVHRKAIPAARPVMMSGVATERLSVMP